jgi:hypothetical protein
VKVEVRLIGAPTGPPTPWRLPSPAWMAWVWAPSGRGTADFAFADFFGDEVFMMASFCAAASGAAKRQIGELRARLARVGCADGHEIRVGRNP